MLRRKKNRLQKRSRRKIRMNKERIVPRLPTVSKMTSGKPKAGQKTTTDCQTLKK